MANKKYPHLFSPLQIGTITVKNRIALAPMSFTQRSPDGGFAEENLRYIEEVAQTAYEVRSGERGLSPRELDVLKFVSKGCANTEIAELLGVSHNTVKNHLKAIFEKMGAADRAEAVALALRRGVIS